MSKVVMFECNNCPAQIRETATDSEISLWLLRRRFKQHPVDFCSVLCEAEWLDCQSADPGDWSTDPHVVKYCRLYGLEIVTPELNERLRAEARQQGAIV